MAVDTTFVLGYGSIAKISFLGLGTNTDDGRNYIALTRGSFQRNFQRELVAPYHIPFSDAKRSKILMNYGKYTFSGSISFQLTNGIINNLFDKELKFLNGRTRMINLSVFDGEYMVKMPQCVWSNFQVNASANEAIDCSLSFSSLNGYKQDIEVRTSKNQDFASQNPVELLQPYWKYGMSDNNYKHLIQSFTLTFSRSVSPVFLNNDLKTPSYLRVGMVDFDMNITCLQEWFIDNEIKLGDKTLTVQGDYIPTQSMEFSGMSGQGMKTYTMKGSNKATESVFSIS